ncbi:MAG TPA: ABC transporter ATP-binding protein [Gaiellaceae bacterium]|jgi:molybdate transport system ATP-binding protein
MALELDFSHPLRSFVAALQLTVPRGTTTALVGPSGAGKTTVLRVIAGLLRPREGTLSVDGVPWLDTSRGHDLPPEKRRVGYLFQEYALFPHLDVSQNVRFGALDNMLADAMLDRFGISHLRHAHTRDLSGGERQRVGLARALARAPDVLLLDEPLSALDAHTKVAVRLELHQHLRDLDLPAIVVTHDFEDAAALAHTIGVIVDGKLLQTGTAAELVTAPSDPFVATFTGATLLPGTAVGRHDGLTEVLLDSGATAWSTEPATGRVHLAVYPWDITLAREQTESSLNNHLRGPITSIVPIGDRARVRVGQIVAEITAASARRLELSEGDVVIASFKATAARLLSDT